MNTRFSKLLVVAALVAASALSSQPASAAFSSSALVKASPVGVANAPAIFTYKSAADALATIEASNYFQSAGLRAGDLIWAFGSDGKVMLSVTVDADNVLNLDVGGTNMTGSATIASSGVAVGDVDSATVSASNTVTAGNLINVESDGGGTVGAGTTCIQITP